MTLTNVSLLLPAPSRPNGPCRGSPKPSFPAATKTARTTYHSAHPELIRLMICTWKLVVAMTARTICGTASWTQTCVNNFLELSRLGLGGLSTGCCLASSRTGSRRSSSVSAPRSRCWAEGGSTMGAKVRVCSIGGRRLLAGGRSRGLWKSRRGWWWLDERGCLRWVL